MDFREEAVKAIAKAGVEEGLARGAIEVPPERNMGDFAFPCFALAKEMKKSPAEIASEIAGKISLAKCFSKAEAKGPYVNFFIDENKYAESAVTEILGGKAGAGKKKSGKIIVEYCQANPMKSFHIGHVRNICMGEAVARLFEARGENVIRVNYGGDVGPHVSKTLYAYRNIWKGKIPEETRAQGKWLGELYARGAKEVKEKPELEEKMREMVVLLEKGDKSLKKDWAKLRKMSLDYFDSIYRELGIKFDRIILESEVEKEGIAIAEKLYAEGFAEKDDGALLVDLKKYNLDKFLILKSDGAALYSSKDLALAKLKKTELKADKSYNVVGSEQRFYFKQLIKTIELLNERKNEYCETVHIPYELVRLEGGKMASREGKVITYSELFERIFEKISEETKKRHTDWKEKKASSNSEKLALAAIKFGMLCQDKNKTITFNWEKATSLEGETGPFVIYSYARANSILAKTKLKGTPKSGEFNAETEKEKALISVLAKFNSKLSEAAETLSPHKLAYYLLELASEFNSFYHEVPVLKAEGKALATRIALVEAVAKAIKIGMETLNIEITGEM